MCSEAYLTPIVRRYVEGFLSGFKIQPQRVDFMCSDGGLKHSEKFSGNAALLSGPAGGVVGIARSCYDPSEGTAVIGFDMVKLTLISPPNFMSLIICRAVQARIFHDMMENSSTFILQVLRAVLLAQRCWISQLLRLVVALF